MERPRPGWYRDRQVPNLARYWDGTAWTGETRQIPSAASPPAGAGGQPATRASNEAPETPAGRPSPPTAVAQPQTAREQPVESVEAVGPHRPGLTRLLGLYDYPLWEDWLTWPTAVAVFGATLDVTRDHWPGVRGNGTSEAGFVSIAFDLALAVVLALAIFGLVPAVLRDLWRRRKRAGGVSGETSLASSPAPEPGNAFPLQFVLLVLVLPMVLAFIAGKSA